MAASIASEDSITDASVSSLGTRVPLPGCFLKQLAEDIEENGGIQNLIGSKHTLRRLLDKHPERYGNQTDPLRTKIRNKVYKWQQKHKEGKYASDVLNALEVKSAANRAKEKKKSQRKSPARPKPQPVVVDDISLSGSSTSEESIVQPVIPPKRRRGKKKIAKAKQEPKTPAPPSVVTVSVAPADKLSVAFSPLSLSDRKMAALPPNTGTFYFFHLETKNI